jgi:glucokinase
MKSFLGIDWGGTYIKAGVVNDRGKILKQVAYASKSLTDKKAFIDNVVLMVKNLRSFKIKAVGIGAPGIINLKKGFIYYLPNIPGWKNFPLKSVLRKKLKMPVFVNNDANTFGLAESRFGAGRGKSRVIFLTLGTGLGGAVILNNQILSADTSALELGHVPLSTKGKICGCGGRGCIQTFVGNGYILDEYKRLKKNKTNINGVKEIFARALKGEKEALAVWEGFSLALGKFLSGMINIFNPQVVIFGGGVSGAFNLFKPRLWEIIKEQAMWPLSKDVKLIKAKLKDSGIIGAALLAKDSL